MTAFRISGRAVVLPLALWLTASGAAAAQEPGPPTSILPRILVPPPTETAPSQPADEPAPSDTGHQDTGDQPAAAQGDAPTQSSIALPPPVSVGDLGTLEGPIAGTLDEAAGGLGYAEWEGSERGAVEAILQHLAAATPSATARLLLRKVLLTPAPPPRGRGSEAFDGLRLRKLLEGGFVADAADLAMKIESRDAATRRLQADALLYAGRDDAACSDITAQRLDSADSFWVELRAYCYAVAGDSGALELTRAVMEQQGIADPSFLALLDALAGPMPVAPDSFFTATAIHLRLLVRLHLPIPALFTRELGLPADLLAVASVQTAKEVRLASAERAFRAGALTPDMLKQSLDLIAFKPQDLIGAPAIARQEPLLSGLARLRAALKVQRQPATRAEAVATALMIGEAQGVLPQVASLFADEASALSPSPEFAGWASLIARGLLLVGKDVEAARWIALLDDNGIAQNDVAGPLRVTLALAQPTDVRLAQIQEVLIALAQASQASDVTPATLVRAALALGLFETTSRDMPEGARAQATALAMIEFPGRRPPPAALQRIEAAALANRKGETGLGIADALGRKGAGDLPPDVAVRLVRALKTAGMQDAARALTLEALLTRPDN